MVMVKRFFLEIKSNERKKPLKIKLPENFEIILDDRRDFSLNKFLYKQVGTDHYWKDRLIWSDQEWLEYVSNLNLETWVIKHKGNVVGFYEQEFHPAKNEIELINVGILKEYRGKKLGSVLVLHAIERAFSNKLKRMWVHTCSLDHKFALKNYESKGFKIYKKESVEFDI
jgi:ribosomal protein S18 acetylase RimI-like enzyme